MRVWREADELEGRELMHYGRELMHYGRCLAA
jgi:hypothetical protein